jgi:hypothetical protein
VTDGGDDGLEFKVWPGGEGWLLLLLLDIPGKLKKCNFEI